jgi:hypothetical protein
MGIRHGIYSDLPYHFGNARARFGSKPPHYELETPILDIFCNKRKQAGRAHDDMTPTPDDTTTFHDAMPAPSTKQGPRQVMIARPRHHFHRTLRLSWDLVVRAKSAVQNCLIKVWKAAGAGVQPLTIHAGPAFGDVPRERTRVVHGRLRSVHREKSLAVVHRD